MPKKRNQRKANQHKLGDKNVAHKSSKRTTIKRVFVKNFSGGIRRGIKRRNLRKVRRNKNNISRYENSTDYIRRLLRRKQYVNKPVGNKYDRKSKIFFSGKRISRQKFRTIAYLIRVQITGYAEDSKTVLWWRRIKSLKPKTLIQWSSLLTRPMYIGAIEDQVQQSHANFIELIGIEGVK